MGATEAPPVSTSRRSRPRRALTAAPERTRVPATVSLSHPDRGDVHRGESLTGAGSECASHRDAGLCCVKSVSDPAEGSAGGLLCEAVSVIRPEVPDWIREEPDRCCTCPGHGPAHQYTSGPSCMNIHPESGHISKQYTAQCNTHIIQINQ